MSFFSGPAGRLLRSDKPDFLHPKNSVPGRPDDRPRRRSSGKGGKNVAIVAVPVVDEKNLATGETKLAIGAGLKPVRSQVDGNGTEYFQFPGGQIRRQIGQGHSMLEREARRAHLKVRGRAIKANQADYNRWMAGLSPADAAFARAHKLHRPPAESGCQGAKGREDMLDLAEQEPIPHAQVRGTHNGRDVVATTHEQLDQLEPETFAVEIDGLSAAEIVAVAEDFGDALQWAFSSSAGSSADHLLVELGKRSCVLIAGLAPEFADGLPVNPELARRFLGYFGGSFAETLARLQETGARYRRLLEWLGRGSDLAELGERLQIVAYQIRPDIIDAPTMAKMGSPTNKTRQAINKVVQCLRDTAGGLCALVQRPDHTRVRCQAAQLATA